MNKLLMTASTYSHIRSFHLPYLWKFQQLGWETHIGSSGIPDELPACVDRAIALPFEKKMTAPANFQAARILRDRIRAERYDLIVTHTALAAFFTRLAVKGLKNRPQIVNVVHGYLFDDETPFLKRSVLLTAEHLTAPETDLLLTMNDWDDHAAKRYRLGKQIEKIPGIGVDFSRLDAATAADGAALRDTLGIPADAFVLIYPAEFSARKSQHVLIEAMALLPERTVLVLPGSGALLEQCKARAQQLGLGERVLFPGYISDMAPWYRMADAAVTASRSEGLPFNVMEAMYCNLPVIASSVKGHTDLIEDGVTGLLYPYGDAAACAERIRKLTEDDVLRARLAMNAKAQTAQYGLDAVLEIVMGQYEAMNAHAESLQMGI